MNRSKHAHVYQLIACGVVVVLFLSIVNAGLSYRTNKRLAQEEAQRQTEIKQKKKKQHNWQIRRKPVIPKVQRR